MPTAFPVIERALEINFGDLYEDTLPPDEIQIEWERRHWRHARVLSDALRSVRVAWTLDASAGILRHHVLSPYWATNQEDDLVAWAGDIVAEIAPDDLQPLAPPDDDSWLQQFQELTSKWHEETDHLSAPTDIAMNFNYQQIIGKGDRFLPFIFDELRTNGGNWYWALRAITGVDPVAPADRGSVAKMKQAWLKWWEQHS